jgi:hypothetical protein
MLGAIGCASPVAGGAVTQAEDERNAASPDSLPEVTCVGAPAAGPTKPWRHPFTSPLTVALGAPQHRGIDLIAGADVAVQQLRGEIRYGVVDKALEDENVDLFACHAGAWQAIGTTRTDGEGNFELDLSDVSRLSIGQRSVYVSVAGDRSGVGFVALVAPTGSWVAASDVDGTLTSSENAFPEALITQAPVAVQPGAPAALTALHARGYLPVYVTARGRVFTEATRAWLAAEGFPRGPLRLADSLITLPGSATVAYKSSVFSAIDGAGVKVTVGFGNRATDAEAYASAALAGENVFLKLPEFASECAPLIAQGEAVGFDSYVTLTPTLATLPLAP